MVSPPKHLFSAPSSVHTAERRKREHRLEGENMIDWRVFAILAVVMFYDG
jgi:hypothetical protein